MSKQRKSRKRAPHTHADVTLNDFANSIVIKTRPKKATANVTTVIKQLEVDDKSWDDKEEDFEGEFVEEIDEDGNISYVIRKIEPRRRQKTVSSSENRQNNDRGGFVYPIDIWFLISEYIRPEDVGRFAGICKTAYEVASTAKFWFGMYKRHYKTGCHLPERLQPECLFRKYGLRASVIRALFFMYPPFVSRLKSLAGAEEHPDALKRAQCVLMWRQETKTNCLYYFKMRLKRSQEPPHRREARDSRPKPDLLQMLDDVYANRDEECRMLMVVCTRVIPIAPVLGLALKAAQLTLGAELRAHKLQLRFGSEIERAGGGGGVGEGVLIVLEPVINVKVLDWWHPLYPHRCNLADLVGEE